ncbi:hypothetical protein EMPS_09156 [Entomortierella parvispora]|uniref:EF-hand domain-containing protein n=1 Tax=Entomortierella parvispora TaxID=205924 RepID=A0A9P3HHN4_9FUNG|nr:hypothetical protein EMPS_09156 [Entomortierella parvispora]
MSPAVLQHEIPFNADELELMKTLFRDHDHDQDGTLELCEVHAIIDSMEYSVSDQSVANAIHGFDVKNPRNLTYQEFLIVMRDVVPPDHL